MRLTRRTRTTAWAVAFACMVLVGSLALVDGLRAGADSVAGRFETGPAVYIRGTDLLHSLPALLLGPVDRCGPAGRDRGSLGPAARSGRTADSLQRTADERVRRPASAGVP